MRTDVWYHIVVSPLSSITSLVGVVPPCLPRKYDRWSAFKLLENVPLARGLHIFIWRMNPLGFVDSMPDPFGIERNHSDSQWISYVQHRCKEDRCSIYSSSFSPSLFLIFFGVPTCSARLRSALWVVQRWGSAYFLLSNAFIRLFIVWFLYLSIGKWRICALICCFAWTQCLNHLRWKKFCDAQWVSHVKLRCQKQMLNSSRLFSLVPPAPPAQLYWDPPSGWCNGGVCFFLVCNIMKIVFDFERLRTHPLPLHWLALSYILHLRWFHSRGRHLTTLV